MRDELIKIIASKICSRYRKDTCLTKWSSGCGECEGSWNYEIGDFADHLLANGVIVPPCKVGDTLYVISKMKDKRILPFINQYDVTSITIKKKSIVIYHEMDGYIKIFKHTDFGKTVFLTREEAEQALKEADE